MTSHDLHNKEPGAACERWPGSENILMLGSWEHPATALDDVALATITDANLPLRTLSIDLATTIALGAERAKGGAQ